MAQHGAPHPAPGRVILHRAQAVVGPDLPGIQAGHQPGDHLRGRLVGREQSVDGGERLHGRVGPFRIVGLPGIVSIQAGQRFLSLSPAPLLVAQAPHDAGEESDQRHPRRPRPRASHRAHHGLIVAEIGVDMTAFGTAQRLAAWAGVCPASHESAGKQKRRGTRKGNTFLKAALVTAAISAAQAKGTDLRDKFHRLKAGMGSKKAAMAVAHKILVAVFHMLSATQASATLVPVTSTTSTSTTRPSV